jgi:hypothetical protein
VPRARFKKNPIFSFDFALILDILAALADKTEKQFFTAFCESYTLIKKKRKLSSYIGKFRMEQLQSHKWGNICAFPQILGSPSSYMTLQLLHSKFPYI